MARPAQISGTSDVEVFVSRLVSFEVNDSVSSPIRAMLRSYRQRTSNLLRLPDYTIGAQHLWNEMDKVHVSETGFTARMSAIVAATRIQTLITAPMGRQQELGAALKREIDQVITAIQLARSSLDKRADGAASPEPPEDRSSSPDSHLNLPVHSARTVPQHVHVSHAQLLALLSLSPPQGSHSLGRTELRRLREIQDAVATGHTPPHALRTPMEAYAELSGLVQRAIPLEVWDEMRYQRYRRRAVQDIELVTDKISDLANKTCSYQHSPLYRSPIERLRPLAMPLYTSPEEEHKHARSVYIPGRRGLDKAL
ncbi:uncharacterized protein JCM10292_003362 [Rhodotorula paludigena]|uniref:uncharacterized protein n=1 Tax=Rhodotorula paludigena TaxID=86838 RepID=UPI0031799A03